MTGSCAVLSPVEKPNGETEYKQLALLRQGECFGELALLTYKPRAASVICREEAHLAVLERNDYLRVLGKTHEGALQSKLALMMQLPIFAKWSKVALQGLSYFFKERTYKRHQTLFQAGQPVKEVYLVVRGEFQLSKYIHQASKSLPGPPSSRLQIDVTLLTTGELVGAEELIRNNMPHRYSCECRSTQGEVLYIAREDFLGRVTNEETMSYLRLMNETKEVYRHQRVLRLTQMAQEEKAELREHARKLSQSPDLGKSARDALLREKAKLSKLPGVPRFFLSKGARTNSLPSITTDRPRLSEKHTEHFPTPSPTKHESPLHRQTTWDQIVLRKYAVSKAIRKSNHSREPLIVNIHTQLLRTQATLPRTEDHTAGPATSRALSRINLSIEDADVS